MNETDLANYLRNNLKIQISIDQLVKKDKFKVELLLVDEVISSDISVIFKE